VEALPKCGCDDPDCGVQKALTLAEHISRAHMMAAGLSGLDPKHGVYAMLIGAVNVAKALGATRQVIEGLICDICDRLFLEEPRKPEPAHQPVFVAPPSDKTH
jgi:hypothetical protein